MSATVLLLKTQTRLLAWPLLALIAASVAIVCIPVDPLTGINCVVVILAMLLSGPVVFGAEYAEGARDYLETRPVSQRNVFWFKVALLVLIAFVGCEVLAATIQPDYLASFTGFEPLGRVKSRGLLMMAFFLSSTFWLSALTVLSRDLVRGILYGAVSLPLVAGGLIFAASWFFKEHSPLIFSLPGNYLGYETDPQAGVFQVLFLLTVPPLALGLLHSMYLTWVKRRIRFGWIFPIASIFALCSVCLAHECMSYHGKATIQFFGLSSGVAAGRIQGDTLVYIPDKNELTFDTLNLVDSNRLKDPKWTDIIQSTAWNHWHDGIIQDRSVVLFPGPFINNESERSIAFYEIEDGSKLNELKTYDGISYAWIMNPETLWITRQKQPNTYVQLQDGKILDATAPPIIDAILDPVKTGDRVYRYLPEYHRVEIRRQTKVNGALYSSRTSDPILAPAVDGEWLVGFGLDESPGDWALPGGIPPGLIPRIRLLNTNYLGRLDSHVELRIPGSKYVWFKRTADILGWVGLNPLGRNADEAKPSIHLTLGGGYLCLWMSHMGIHLNRVALWEITDRNHIQFIGIFPSVGFSSELERFSLGPFRARGIQPPLEPVLRDDGALGFPIQDNAILWLEIPERMKEPQT
jgi:hypothetical protein